ELAAGPAGRSAGAAPEGLWADSAYGALRRGASCRRRGGGGRFAGYRGRPGRRGGLPGDPVRDRPHLGQEAVEHLLGVVVDTHLAGLAVGLDLVDPALEPVAPRVELPDRALQLLLGLADLALDVVARLDPQLLQLAPHLRALAVAVVLLVEHL